MSIETFLLFLAIVLFGGFSVYLNLKTSDKTMKLLTLVTVYMSILFSVILLAVSFVRHVAG